MFENFDQERRYNSKAVENFKKVSAHANVVNTYDEFAVVEKRNKSDESSLPSWSALIDEQPDEEPKKKFNYVYEEADIEI